MAGASDDLVAVPVIDAVPLLAPERAALLELLAPLQPSEWDAPTECPAWTVAGVALHVLGDDLSLLSRQRDAVLDGLTLFAQSRPELDFRQRLDGFNEQWVTAASFLSPRLICDLLELAGRESEAFYRDVDPSRPGEPVGLFAGTDTSPYWQIAAREYLERWIHQHQIRRALGRPDLGPQFLTMAGEVVAHMVAAHAHLLALQPGTSVVFAIDAVAAWTITVDDAGTNVFRGASPSCDVAVAVGADVATTVLSRGLPGSEVPSVLRTNGSPELGAALVQGFALLAGS